MLAVTGDTHREEGRFIYPNMGFEKLGEGDFLCVTGDFGYVWDDSFGERKYRPFRNRQSLETVVPTFIFVKRMPPSAQ